MDINKNNDYLAKDYKFSIQDIIAIVLLLNIDFRKENFSFEEFAMGVNVELEHGTRFEETNVTDNDAILTGKIAWAHLKEFPDYYSRLKVMEEEADKYWSAKKKKS